MDIRKEAYELYKIDWEHDHGISGKRKLEAYRKYASIELENSVYGSFESYLEDVGYGGELYACYEEFLYAEYMDVEYMYYLLEDTVLVDAYRFDRLKEAMEIAGWQLTEHDGEWTSWQFAPSYDDGEGPFPEVNARNQKSAFGLVKYSYDELQEYLETVIISNPEKEERFNQIVSPKTENTLIQKKEADSQSMSLS